jgi:hypothetical protein
MKIFALILICACTRANAQMPDIAYEPAKQEHESKRTLALQDMSLSMVFNGAEQYQSTREYRDHLLHCTDEELDTIIATSSQDLPYCSAYH